LKANKVNLFVSSVLFVFWYHSPNVLDTPHIWNISRLRVKLGTHKRFKPTHNNTKYYRSQNVRGGEVVEALHYKTEGRGFDSRCCHWIFSLA
jgi:hypothetical protein